jgi:uncharacterized protein
MPQYLSPGVYVEEIDAGPQPIQGVSTSITGAVGVTVQGPTSGKPVLVTSFTDFQNNFGGFLPVPPSAIVNNWASKQNTEGGQWWLFPLAVKGYFDNGGQQLYVKRVFSKTATAAAAALGGGLVAELTSDAAATATVITVRHLVHIDESSKVQIFRGDTGAQIGGDFQVTAYNPTSLQITLGAAVGWPLMTKRGDFVQITPFQAPGNANANATLIFTAKALGAWGSDLSARVRPMVGNVMNILPDPTIAGNNPASTTVVTTVNTPGPPPTTTVTVASVAGFNNQDHILVNGNEFVITNVTPGAAGAPGTFTITPPLTGAQSWSNGTPVRRLRNANTPNTTKTINAWGASSLYTGAIVELDNGHLKETFTVTSTAGNQVTLSDNPKNSYYEGQKLRVIEAEVDVTYQPQNGSPASETFTNLRLINDGSINYLVNYVNQQSAFVTVVEGPNFSSSVLAEFPMAQKGSSQNFAPGDDKLSDLTVDDFVGVDGGSGKRTGIQALEDVTNISICVVPCVWSQTVQSALINHCETLRYRFAILDPPDGLGIQDIQAFRSFDTKFAALYYPWLEVRDPSVGANVNVAPSAHMAGIYAQTDNDRGVFKAPANVEISMITKIAQDVNKREQDVLNPIGINVLRFFPLRGNRVWGARTLSSESSWKYINVKRLFIYVEASIDVGTQWVVFEPNDEPLWARVRQTITDFLTTTWRSGALQGATAAEAFFVKCDRTTMTQDDIDNGRLICVIGIAPVKPAEFVIFRIQQFTQATAAG